MQLIFPYYFKINWVLGIVIYTIIGILSFKEKEIVKSLKWFLLSIGAIVILNMAQDRALFPMAKSIQLEYVELLKENQTEKAEILHSQFSKIHVISSFINITTLALELFILYNFLSFFKKSRNKD